MKYSLSFLICVFFTNLLGNALLPKFFFNPLDDRSPNSTGKFIAKIEQKNPKVVFIGNSIIGRGIDYEELENRLGSPVLEFRYGGSGSALWYLILKNVVVKAQPVPPYVVFVFEDYVFSVPNHHVNENKHLAYINKFAELDEPVFDQLAYLSFITSEQAFLQDKSAWFRYRSLINERMISIVKFPIRKLFTLNASQLDKVVGRVFDPANLDTDLLTAAEQEADRPLANVNISTDFFQSTEFSFLPHMLEIADKNNTTLIFVHYRSRHYVEHPEENEDLDTYFEDMEEYLLEHGAVFIEESTNDSLQIQHYTDGSHLNEEGQYIFTVEISKMLLEIIENR